MAHDDRALRKRTQRAAALLVGTLISQPEVSRLPAEKTEYCKVRILVRGKGEFECDAYGKVTEDCKTMLRGSLIQLVCELVLHTHEKANGSTHKTISLKVIRGKVLRMPTRRRFR
jgi:hypothetical protein